MKREVKVGIFAVLVLLAGWGVTRLLQGADLFSKTNKYYAYYEQVGGIQPAASVVIHGVKVGSVSRISLDEDPTKGVELELSVEKRFRIPADSKAKIFSDGIMGGKAVEIVYGTSAESIENNGVIESESSVDLLQVAGDEFGDLKGRLVAVLDNLTQTLEGVNKLVADNTENLTHIISNVDSVTGDVSELLSNEKAHLEQALASFGEFSKSLGDNAGQIDSIIDNLQLFSAQLSEAKLVESIEGVMTQLDGVLAMVNEQDGSVGKLLKDSALYDNLASASNNLSLLLEDLQSNPGRYINVSVFGGNPYKKVERLKAKAEKKALKQELKEQSEDK